MEYTAVLICFLSCLVFINAIMVMNCTLKLKKHKQMYLKLQNKHIEVLGRWREDLKLIKHYQQFLEECKVKDVIQERNENNGK